MPPTGLGLEHAHFFFCQSRFLGLLCGETETGIPAEYQQNTSKIPVNPSKYRFQNVRIDPQTPRSEYEAIAGQLPAIKFGFCSTAGAVERLFPLESR